jgi:deoxyadenosine/deoxycytidine kinase
VYIAVLNLCSSGRCAQIHMKIYIFTNQFSYRKEVFTKKHSRHTNKSIIQTHMDFKQQTIEGNLQDNAMKYWQHFSGNSFS